MYEWKMKKTEEFIMRDVGIVMPVYKQDPLYLRLALQSVLNQSYERYHFVVVSDGAPEETNEVIRELTKADRRVQFILKDKNEGVSKALNTGFAALMTIEEVKYLTWVSSDNIYFPPFIETLRSVLAQGQDELGLVYSSFRHIDERGKHILNENLPAFRKMQEKPKEKLLDFCYIGTSFMYKKEYAAMISGYFMEPVEDYEYWLRLTEYCDIEYIPVELMDYRVASTHSISAQLRSSVTQHRRWRYMFNLAKHQARLRRRIPFETTVLFPVQHANNEVIEQYERLLEQAYSNYKLIVLDLSEKAFASRVLKHISDPRVSFHEMPNIGFEEALKLGIKSADTPFTFLYGHAPFPKALDALANLMAAHEELSKQKEKADVVSSYFLNGSIPSGDQKVFQSNNGPIGLRMKATELERPPFSELYRTEKLIEMVDRRGNKMEAPLNEREN
jgi:glycosyltransferase involved in cell wall biosynthesis